MKIDFVILWVDGSDKNWLRQKQEYSETELDIDAEANRYRDWDILKYWFRCVEQHAPWVNKIYFVTCGQIPTWLNTKNEKLVLVNHKDYIPEEYLPTFSSHPIELNLHHIKDLSEHFVYFNDDMFLTGDCKEDDFFKNGLPCDMAIEEPYSFNKRDYFNDILINNIIAINQHFNRKESLKTNRKKIYCTKNKKVLIKNLALSLLKRDDFFGFEYHHLPQPFLKSMFTKVWEGNYDWLDETCHNKFRSKNDINQYIIKFYQYLTGQFTPYDWKKNGMAIHLDDTESHNIDYACECISNGKYKMICLNDMTVNHFDETKQKIINAFESKYCSKSSFEL